MSLMRPAVFDDIGVAGSFLRTTICHCGPGAPVSRGGLRMAIRSRFAHVASLLCLLASGALSGVTARAEESWDAIYLGGHKIGWVHTFVEKVKHNGKQYYRVRIDCEQQLKRDRDVTVVKLQYGTIEAPDGQVLRLATLTATGEQKLSGHGDVIQGKMKFILEGSGNSQEMEIPWGPDVRGPYAAEQSMARHPMKENETRALKMFMPTLNKICDIELQAKGIEKTIMGDGSMRELLRIDQTTKVDGKPSPEFDLKVWVDAHGQVLKQHQDLLGGYIQYRTTKKAALAPVDPRAQFDLIAGTVIKVSARMTNPDKTQYVKYRVALEDADPAAIIPNDARQTVTPQGDKRSAILEVKSLGPLDGPTDPGEVDPSYLRANALVTSEDAEVRRLARQAVGNAVDPWEKVTKITQWVHKSITNKNFNVGFAAASEVARNLEGDCTEHAVLAAAMCRACDIPARVVIGLIYEPLRLKGFGYHMWCEVYVNHRWVAVDPSWKQANVDAVHIKISDSSLEGVSPFEAFLPVLRLMGKTQIETIELR
jgi:Transglutaminase-like superfamily